MAPGLVHRCTVRLCGREAKVGDSNILTANFCPDPQSFRLATDQSRSLCKITIMALRESQLLHLHTLLAFTFALTAPLMAAPSIVRADTTPATAQIEPLTQATVRKAINGIVVELREGYVFPSK